VITYQRRNLLTAVGREYHIISASTEVAVSMMTRKTQDQYVSEKLTHRVSASKLEIVKCVVILGYSQTSALRKAGALTQASTRKKDHGASLEKKIE